MEKYKIDVFKYTKYLFQDVFNEWNSSSLQEADANLICYITQRDVYS